jgi:hypothetical protein
MRTEEEYVALKLELAKSNERLAEVEALAEARLLQMQEDRRQYLDIKAARSGVPDGYIVGSGGRATYVVWSKEAKKYVEDGGNIAVFSKERAEDWFPAHTFEVREIRYVLQSAPASPAPETKCKTCNGAGGEEVPTSSTNYVWRNCPDCKPAPPQSAEKKKE